MSNTKCNQTDSSKARDRAIRFLQRLQKSRDIGVLPLPSCFEPEDSLYFEMCWQFGVARISVTAFKDGHFEMSVDAPGSKSWEDATMLPLPPISFLQRFRPLVRTLRPQKIPSRGFALHIV